MKFYLEYQYLSGIIDGDKYHELVDPIKSTSKIIFRKSGSRDVGACVGVAHGGLISLSEDLIERIKKIENYHFIAEGIAAKDHSKEPFMMDFINRHFPGKTVGPKSWDDITEEKNKGVGNPNYNIVYIFMQHEFNRYIDFYTYSKGSMVDALAKPTRRNFPPNSPQEPVERKKWIEFHMRKAGFLDELEQPYDREKLFQLLTKMEETVYPPNHEEPDSSTYFGRMQLQIEKERNQTIYDLMKNGGVCIAGHGHLDELKTQFPDLEFIK